MASVLYMHFDGELVAEDRGGTVSHYVSDTLGSTMAIVDSTGFITDQFEYWPYGEEFSRTGTTPTPFTWVGTLGYFKDTAARFYVRMRSYLASAGSWTRVDPLWPRQSAYGYVNGRALDSVDPLGMIGILIVGCVGSCALCVACLIDLGYVCSDCGSDVNCWIKCIQSVVQNLPPWARFLCGASCATCAFCTTVALCVAASAGVDSCSVPDTPWTDCYKKCLEDTNKMCEESYTDEAAVCACKIWAKAYCIKRCADFPGRPPKKRRKNSGVTMPPVLAGAY